MFPFSSAIKKALILIKTLSKLSSYFL